MSRVVFSSITIKSFLLLPFSSSIRFRIFKSSSASRVCRMASESSSDSSSSPSPSSAIDFLSLCHRLKSTKRAGWVKRDIKGPESIADHMYRMGLMALIASDTPGVNRDKCIKMAIVHDVAEGSHAGRESQLSSRPTILWGKMRLEGLFAEWTRPHRQIYIPSPPSLLYYAAFGRFCMLSQLPCKNLLTKTSLI